MKTPLRIILAIFFILLGFASYGYHHWKKGQQVIADEPIQAAMDAEPEEQTPPKVDVVFALDATGSMSGLIKTAKEKIWSIATTMAQADPAPDIRVGIVFYRDRSDNFVTKKVPLSQDLDEVYEDLLAIEASGGGDTPESVNQGLYEAVTDMEWSDHPEAYKSVFLVGDCPPHMDYADDIKYPETCRIGTEKGIFINSIQLGNCAGTTPIWQEIAKLGSGQYIKVSQSGDGLSLNTPYDEEIATLSNKIDNTRFYWGNTDQKQKFQAKKARSNKLFETADKSTSSRRAEYNFSESGKKGYYGKQEIVTAIENEELDLDTVAVERLPDELKDLSVGERFEFIEQEKKKRNNYQTEMDELVQKRNAYIKNSLKGKEETSINSFSGKVYKAVKDQAKTKGIDYDAVELKH